MSDIDYDKKIALCKKLGADRFKKIVHIAEKLKFKVLKNVFPHYIENYDKRIDKELSRAMKKTHSKEEQEALLRLAKRDKMLIRKENNTEENRNYHIDKNNPEAIIDYLKWNKNVHVKGLIINALTATSIIAISTQLPAILPLIALEAADAFLNFQCINIQNCNIYRYEKNKDKIQKMSQAKMKHNIERYGKFAKIVDKELNENNYNLPKPKEITSKIQTKEELLQAMDIAIDELKSRGNIERANSLIEKKNKLLNKKENRKVKVYD